jgi:Family of unknown function (DUF6314)
VRAVSTSGQTWQLAGGTLDFLRGTWRAERVLTDFRSGQTGSFSGVATFIERTAGVAGAATPSGLVIAYREQGELCFGGHCGPASRSLLYLPAGDGAATVLFADGRPFYPLDLRSGSCQAEHPCGPDSYLVTVRVLGPDAYTERWRASGPGKNYEMTTTLARIGPAE